MKQKFYIFMLLLTFFPLSLWAKKNNGLVEFSYYGSRWAVHVSEHLRFPYSETSTNAIFDTLSIEKYIQDTYQDCMTLKSQKNLNDWAYFNMLDSLSVVCFGKGNEAKLMKTYLFSKSGYKTILTKDSLNQLYVCCQSNYSIYSRQFITYKGESYYFDDSNHSKSEIVSSFCPTGKSVKMDMRQHPVLEMKRTEKRKFQSKAFKNYPSLTIEVSQNQNLLDFYTQYPRSSKNFDFITQWAIMANIRLDEDVKKQIYPVLTKAIAGRSQHEAVQALTYFVQTALEYEFDNKVWGHDRAFYAEETLFYPYADDEDRVILLSRLVRDLVGLEVVIFYYPGHLALGVHFDEDVEGTHVIYNGDRFVLCDPTYINARVGRAMPQFKEEDPERMILLY